MNRIRRFLASLRPPRYLPAPHPSCRTYSDAGWVQRVKNHETARRISAAHS